MAPHLVIVLSDDVLNAVASGGSFTLRTGSGDRIAPQPAGGAPNYRAGSLPARLLTWAGEHGGEFDASDIVKALGVSRAHVSMLLNKLVNDPGPVRRIARGVYAFEGAADDTPTPGRRKVKKRAKKK